MQSDKIKFFKHFLIWIKIFRRILVLNGLHVTLCLSTSISVELQKQKTKDLNNKLNLRSLIRASQFNANKNVTDATVYTYLITAKLLCIFQDSQHPSSGVLKNVPAQYTKKIVTKLSKAIGSAMYCGTAQ